MEELVKKEDITATTNKLYALRAGLSLVDKEYDKMSKVENRSIGVSEFIRSEIRTKTEEISRKQRDIEYLQENADKEKRSYEREIATVQENKTDALNEISKLKKERNKQLIRVIICATALIVAVLISIVSSVLIFESNIDLFIAPLAIFGIIAVALFYVVIPIFSFFLIRCLIRIKNKNKYIEQLEIPKFKESKNYSQLIENLKEEKINEEKELRLLSTKNESNNSQAAKEMAIYSQKAYEMYKLVVSNFSETLPNLDARDYKHVDLIIYMLETGRAETMKEALQLTDTANYRSMVISALGAISKNIVDNIQSLKSKIEQNIYELGNKIDRLTYNVNNMSDRQSALISELNENITKTNSSIEMQNALFEKANVSSAKMAENVEKMRLYADEAYIKKVNYW